jgi:hypothetical protein
VLPTHVFGEAITETSKIHDLFNSIQIIHNIIYWNPLENGDKTHKNICHFNNSKYYQQLKVTVLGKLP